MQEGKSVLAFPDGTRLVMPGKPVKKGVTVLKINKQQVNDHSYAFVCQLRALSKQEDDEGYNSRSSMDSEGEDPHPPNTPSTPLTSLAVPMSPDGCDSMLGSPEPCGPTPETPGCSSGSSTTALVNITGGPHIDIPSPGGSQGPLSPILTGIHPPAAGSAKPAKIVIVKRDGAAASIAKQQEDSKLMPSPSTNGSNIRLIPGSNSNGTKLVTTSGVNGTSNGKNIVLRTLLKQKPILGVLPTASNVLSPTGAQGIKSNFPPAASSVGSVVEQHQSGAASSLQQDGSTIENLDSCQEQSLEVSIISSGPESIVPSTTSDTNIVQSESDSLPHVTVTSQDTVCVGDNKKEQSIIEQSQVGDVDYSSDVALQSQDHLETGIKSENQTLTQTKGATHLETENHSVSEVCSMNEGEQLTVLENSGEVTDSSMGKAVELTPAGSSEGVVECTTAKSTELVNSTSGKLAESVTENISQEITQNNLDNEVSQITSDMTSVIDEPPKITLSGLDTTDPLGSMEQSSGNKYIIQDDLPPKEKLEHCQEISVGDPEAVEGVSSQGETVYITNSDETDAVSVGSPEAPVVGSPLRPTQPTVQSPTKPGKPSSSDLTLLSPATPVEGEVIVDSGVAAPSKAPVSSSPSVGAPPSAVTVASLTGLLQAQQANLTTKVKYL